MFIRSVFNDQAQGCVATSFVHQSENYASRPLRVESLMPVGGVVSSDGVEADFLKFNAGAVATIGPAAEVARLVPAD